jgi:hypothetical protein
VCGLIAEFANSGYRFANRGTFRGVLTVFHLLFVLLVVGPTARAGVCDEAYKKLGKPVAIVLYHGAKTNFYGPVVLPVRAIHAGIKGIIGLFRPEAKDPAPFFLVKDKWHALGYVALKILQLTTGNTYNQFQKNTASFDEDSGENELRVIVDGFQKNDPYYAGAGRYIYELLKKKNKKVEFVFAEDTEKMLEGLDEVVKRRRKKITHLDYYGHGLPGYLEAVSFGQAPSPYLVDKDKTTGKMTYEKPSLSEHNDLFAKGAKIRFSSCFVVNGEYGAKFKDKVARVLIHDGGGEIFGSQVQILPNLAELLSLWTRSSEPPAWLREYGDWVSVYNGIPTLISGAQAKYYGATNHYPFYFQRAQRTKVDARLPGQKENKNQFESEMTTKLLGRADKFVANMNETKALPEQFEEIDKYASNQGFVVETHKTNNTKELELRTYSKERLEDVVRQARKASPDLSFSLESQPPDFVLRIYYPTNDYALRDRFIRSYQTLRQDLRSLSAETGDRLEDMRRKGSLSGVDYRQEKDRLEALSAGVSSDMEGEFLKKFQSFSNKPSITDLFQKTNDRLTKLVTRLVSDKLGEISQSGLAIYDGISMFFTDKKKLDHALSVFPRSVVNPVGVSGYFWMDVVLPPESAKLVSVEVSREFRLLRKAVIEVFDEEIRSLEESEERKLLTHEEAEMAKQYSLGVKKYFLKDEEELSGRSRWDKIIKP